MGTVLGQNGKPARGTPLYGFELPPPIPGRAFPEFNGNGQYRLPDPATGKPTSYTRASTVAKAMEDTYMLNAWQQRQMLIGMYQDPDLIGKLSDTVFLHQGPGVDLAKELRDPLNDLSERAQNAAGTGRAAEFGTAVHAWCEVVDIGMVHLTQVPELYKPWVYGHRLALAEAGITIDPAHTERVVLNTEYGIAGTFDRLFGTPDIWGNPELRMGDIKTSKGMSFSWMYFSIQMAIYAGASHMLSLDGKSWEPMPTLEYDYALISHLPRLDPEGATIVPINLYFGQEALAAAWKVRDLRRRAGKEVQSTDYVVGFAKEEEMRIRQLRYLIETSHSDADMAQLWENNQDVWNDDLTMLARNSIRTASANVTAK